MEYLLDRSPIKFPVMFKRSHDQVNLYIFLKNAAVAEIWQYVDPSVDIEHASEVYIFGPAWGRFRTSLFDQQVVEERNGL